MNFNDLMIYCGNISRFLMLKDAKSVAAWDAPVVHNLIIKCK
jgi:hypothetical protein